MRNASTLALLFVCLVSPLRAEDWFQFRGPTGQGHSTETGLPVHWTSTENVAWRTEIPGLGWSSPIVVAGRIYLTTAVPEGDDQSGPQSLRTICLDARTGGMVWNVEVFRQPESVRIHGKNSHASPTPICDGTRLFVHFGTQGTACLDLAGKVLWTNEELKYDPVHGNGGSPVLVSDALVVSCDGDDAQFVAALEQKSGKIRWKMPRRTTPVKGFSFGTPLVIDVGGAQQVVSSGSDAVFAYDPRDGREIWKVGYPGGYSVVPRPVFGQGLLFVCTGYNTPALLAIDPQGAAGDVTDSHVVWQVKKAVPHNPSPLLVDDALYLISDGGVATCLEAKTGRERWQQRIGGGFSASPLFADGRIYIQSEGGEGVVFKPSPKYEELGRNSAGERALASYATSDGAIFVRSEGHLMRVQGAAAGERRP